MAKRQTVMIVYWNYAGKEFEKRFTGTPEEIEAEVERLSSLADVAGASVQR